MTCWNDQHSCLFVVATVVVVFFVLWKKILIPSKTFEVLFSEALAVVFSEACYTLLDSLGILMTGPTSAFSVFDALEETSDITVGFTVAHC